MTDLTEKDCRALRLKIADREGDIVVSIQALAAKWGITLT